MDNGVLVLVNDTRYNCQSFLSFIFFIIARSTTFLTFHVRSFVYSEGEENLEAGLLVLVSLSDEVDTLIWLEEHVRIKIRTLRKDMYRWIGNSQSRCSSRVQGWQP